MTIDGMGARLKLRLLRAFGNVPSAISAAMARGSLDLTRLLASGFALMTSKVILPGASPESTVAEAAAVGFTLSDLARLRLRDVSASAS